MGEMYANGLLEIRCKQNASQNTSIPSEGDETKTAGSHGSPVEGFALENHVGRAGRGKVRQLRLDPVEKSREDEEASNW